MKGNSFTINVARYPISSVGVNGYFKSMYSANFRQVLMFGETPEEDEIHMIVDTG